MNRFIHRIVSSSGSSSTRRSTAKKKVLSVDQFLNEIVPWAYASKKKTRMNTNTKNRLSSQQPRLIWFGEFHSEERIIAFQNELVERLLSVPPSLLLSSSSSLTSSSVANGTALEQEQIQAPENTTLHIVTK